MVQEGPPQAAVRRAAHHRHLAPVPQVAEQAPMPVPLLVQVDQVVVPMRVLLDQVLQVRAIQAAPEAAMDRAVPVAVVQVKQAALGPSASAEVVMAMFGSTAQLMQVAVVVKAA